MVLFDMSATEWRSTVLICKSFTKHIYWEYIMCHLMERKLKEIKETGNAIEEYVTKEIWLMKPVP